MSVTTDGLITNTTVTSLLDLVSKKENVLKPSYEVTHTRKKGDGFMSVIYDAKIKDDDKEVLSVIVKLAPENKVFREMSRIRVLFENETLFYNEVYPAFRQFQQEKGIKEIFDFVPKCYATTMKEENEGLVLENLGDKGYRVYNRMIAMDEDHLELTVKAYAKYHALSFAFRDQHKNEYDDLCSKILDIYEEFSNHPGHKEMFEKMITNTMSFLDPIEDKKHLDKFKNYADSMESWHDRFFSKNMDKYCIIGHGDCWCNNIMYKYDNPDHPTKPTGICFLDFQLLRYTTPITDLTHYFYTASSKKAQDNLDYYLDLYYDTLTDFVKQLGSDPEEVYPRSIFDEHWKKYCINGINVGLFMIKVMSSESDEVPDFTNAKENDTIMTAMEYEPKNSDYKKRVRDIIVHFSERGFI